MGGRFKRASAVAIGALLALLGGPALACPSCRLGRVVRGTVFGDGFLVTLAAVVLPLLVMSGFAALLYRRDAR